MKKIFKIILISIVIFVIAAVVFALIAFGDFISYTATGTELREHTGPLKGEALVVYNPGLSGGAKEAASKIADLLVSKGFQVRFAGVRSEAAANTSSYHVIVVGGPVYGGKPVQSVQSYLNNLDPSSETLVGVFGMGGGPEETTDLHAIASEVASLPSDSSVVLMTVMKIATSENIDERCQLFVSNLLEPPKT